MTWIKRLAVHFTCVLSLSFVALQATGQKLGIGDPAPALTQGKYVKGEPVKSFEAGKVYVLEFWATWCGPCVDAIPHVSKLQAEYGDDKVVFIGQNVWENDEAGVPAFVERMGDDMNYRVALDDKSANPDGAMATNYMLAAGQNGIPAAFIIDQQGTIAWIGHPMSLDAPLAKIVAGNYDAAAAKAEQEQMQAFQAAMQNELFPLMGEGKLAEAGAVLDGMAEKFIPLAGQIRLMQFGLYLQIDDMDQAYLALQQAIEGLADDPQTLNEVAFAVATDPQFEGKRNLPVAQKAAESAVATTQRQDADCLDTLARIHFLRGNKDEAIAVQKEAIALAEGDEKIAFEATLAEYAG